MASLMLVLMSLASVDVDQLERMTNEQFAAYTRTQISALNKLVNDRSTAERTIQSFFRYLNAREELICLESEVWNREQKGSIEKTTRDEAEAVRNSFFFGLPLKYWSQFRGISLRKCLDERQTYGYKIVGVAPAGQRTSTIEVLAHNTTPLSATRPLKGYEVEGRKDGFRYRFSLTNVGGEWRIRQIEEKNSYDEDWSKKFDEEFMGPSIPYRVPVDSL